MEGGPTCWLATEKEYAGMVLIPPFESTYRTVTRVPIFLGDRFVNFDRIVGMKEPLLIVHGTVDKAIPYGHGESLFELSPSLEKEFFSINGGRHNDLLVVTSDETLAALDRLAARVERGSLLAFENRLELVGAFCLRRSRTIVSEEAEGFWSELLLFERYFESSFGFLHVGVVIVAHPGVA